MISLKKCLEVMHSGAVFSLRVVSYDKRRPQKSGEVKYYPEATLVWGSMHESETRASERAMTALERSLLAAAPDTIKRDPHHQEHYTRNIRVLVDGHQTAIIKKIHPLLIIEFNGQITTP